MSEINWLSQLKDESIAKINQVGWPNSKDEAWSLSDIKPWLKTINNVYCSPSDNSETLDLLSDDIKKIIQDFDYFLIFHNGEYQKNFSKSQHDYSIQLQSVAEALGSNSETIKNIAHYYQDEPSKNLKAFGYQNLAHFLDGTYLEITNKNARSRIAIVFITSKHTHMKSSEAFIECNKNLFIIKDNANVEILEIYIAKDDAEFFTNSSSKYLLSSGSNVSVTQMCKYNQNSVFLMDSVFKLDQDAHLKLAQISQGSGSSRFETEIALLKEKSSVEFQSIGLGEKASSHDFSTSIKHIKGQTISRQKSMGIYSEKSKGVFSGHLLIEKNAQKSDAKQTSKNVIVGNDAQASARPQLEVYADDVKAAHGATVGQIREDEVFYLMSRGIDKNMAIQLLTQGLSNSVANHLGTWLKDKTVQLMNLNVKIDNGV